jgi:membrane associated rhomboid family serine protease
MIKPGQPSIYVSSITPLRFVFVMWLLFTLDFVYGYHFSQFGILPRNIYGLTGVITAPLLHKGITHIVSNSFPIILLGVALFYLHHKVAKKVFYGSYLLVNIIVWIFGRPLMHIGASGLIYAMAFFIVVSGLLSKKIIPTIISLILLIGYSGLIYGLIPSNYLYSWEMHIAGALAGVGFAIYYKLKNAI